MLREGEGKRKRRIFAVKRNLDDNATVTTGKATAAKAGTAAAANATDTNSRCSTGKSDAGDTAEVSITAAADMVAMVVVMGVAAARDSTSAAAAATAPSPMTTGQRHHGELVPMRHGSLVGFLPPLSQCKSISPPCWDPLTGGPGSDGFWEAILKDEHECPNKRRAEPKKHATEIGPKGPFHYQNSLVNCSDTITVCASAHIRFQMNGSKDAKHDGPERAAGCVRKERVKGTAMHKC